MKKKLKICIVSSVGGHLSEINELRYIFEKYEYFYVLNDFIYLPDFMKDKTYFITRATRRVPIIKNAFEFLKIFLKEKPDIVISCGAGQVVPCFLVSKIFGSVNVYIETFCAVDQPSLTGKLVYKLRLYDYFYVQWEELLRYFPGAKYSGVVYDIFNHR